MTEFFRLLGNSPEHWQPQKLLVFGGSDMSYAMLFFQIQRASIRIADAVESRRIPSRADLKLLGLKPQLFRRRAI